MLMAVTHPVNGVGVDNFTAAYQRMGGVSYVAHSIWIEAMAETGLVAFAVFAGILYLAFKRNAQTRSLASGDEREARFMRAMSDALDLSMVGYLVAGTFTSILYYPFLFMNLALILSLHHIAALRYRATQPSASD